MALAAPNADELQPSVLGQPYCQWKEIVVEVAVVQQRNACRKSDVQAQCQLRKLLLNCALGVGQKLLEANLAACPLRIQLAKRGATCSSVRLTSGLTKNTGATGTAKR